MASHGAFRAVPSIPATLYLPPSPPGCSPYPACMRHAFGCTVHAPPELAAVPCISRRRRPSGEWLSRALQVQLHGPLRMHETHARVCCTVRFEWSRAGRGRCRPLELDTDGIWCCLPGSFPEEFAFKTADGSKTHKVNYPGLILNVMCAEHNANPQYHSLEKQPDGSMGYSVSSRMSIEFEVDGPYLVCPVLLWRRQSHSCSTCSHYRPHACV